MASNEYARRGYKIVDRNARMYMRKQVGEIDLVATKEKEVVFVEVKARRSKSFGEPAEAVDYLKRRRLVMAAQLYLAKRPQFDSYNWRIDVAEVHVDKNPPSVIILENVIEDLD